MQRRFLVLVVMLMAMCCARPLKAEEIPTVTTPDFHDGTWKVIHGDFAVIMYQMNQKSPVDFLLFRWGWEVIYQKEVDGKVAVGKELYSRLGPEQELLYKSWNYGTVPTMYQMLKTSEGWQTLPGNQVAVDWQIRSSFLQSITLSIYI